MRIALILCTALAVAPIVGCFQTQEPAPETARIRVVHASPDAPAVDICANGAAAFSNVAFPSATDYATVEVRGDLPDSRGCDGKRLRWWWRDQRRTPVASRY